MRASNAPPAPGFEEKRQGGIKTSHPYTFPGAGMLQRLLLLLLLWVPGLGARGGKGGALLPGTEQSGCAVRVPARCVCVCRATSSGHGPRSGHGTGDRSRSYRQPPWMPPGAACPVPTRCVWIWCGQGGSGSAVNSGHRGCRGGCVWCSAGGRDGQASSGTGQQAGQCPHPPEPLNH